MKAVRLHSYGGPEVLVYEDAPRPEPAMGEVLVRVRAAGVNPVDWKIRAGYMKEYLRYTLPVILGWDLAGTVEDTGTGVDSWKPGDEVYAMGDPSRNGFYAQYGLIDGSLLARKPRTLDFHQAAAVPLAALTAYHALFRFGNLQKGQRVLIHGAAGGVGSFAVQLAKWKGAQVLGTASGANQDLLRQLGVDQPIDYSKADFTQAARDLDLVLDTVGGEVQEKSFQVLRKGGILESTVGMPSAEKAAEFQVTAKAVANQPDAKILEELGKLIEEGRIKVALETILPLAEARKAHEAIQTGHARGKTILKTA